MRRYRAELRTRFNLRERTHDVAPPRRELEVGAEEMLHAFDGLLAAAELPEERLESHAERPKAAPQAADVRRGRPSGVGRRTVLISRGLLRAFNCSACMQQQDHGLTGARAVLRREADWVENGGRTAHIVADRSQPLPHRAP